MSASAPALKQMIVLADDAPDGLTAYEQLVREADPGPPVIASTDDLLFLYYTSGTTGRPKGVMVGEGGVVLLAESLHEVMHLTETDRYLHVGPMFHAAAPGTLLSVVLAGGCVCVADFEARRCLQLMQQESVTTTNLVPTTLGLLLDVLAQSRYDLSCLRLVAYGAAPMPEATTRRAMATIPARLMQRYGLTEVLPLTYLLPEEHVADGPREITRRVRSVGRAVRGVQLRILDAQDHDVPIGDVGEVIVRGPNVMLGYWKQPTATAEALRGGWMHTGDMGMLDQDGYLYLVDRKKDIIITGGENVYSTEVESVLCQHAAVLEAAVIGLPDQKWGEAVAAIVVLRAGQQASAEEMRAFCRERIAGYKVPRSIDFVDALPKTTTGKISKQELRTRYATSDLPWASGVGPRGDGASRESLGSARTQSNETT
jgi:long-chain acyl-CoA synthetase